MVNILLLLIFLTSCNQNDAAPFVAPGSSVQGYWQGTLSKTMGTQITSSDVSLSLDAQGQFKLRELANGGSVSGKFEDLPRENQISFAFGDDELDGLTLANDKITLSYKIKQDVLDMFDQQTRFTLNRQADRSPTIELALDGTWTCTDDDVYESLKLCAEGGDFWAARSESDTKDFEFIQGTIDYHGNLEDGKEITTQLTIKQIKPERKPETFEELTVVFKTKKKKAVGILRLLITAKDKKSAQVLRCSHPKP